MYLAKCRDIYALSHEYFVDVCVQLEWQPRTRRVRGCHSNCTQTSTKYEGDNAIVINTKIYGNTIVINTKIGFVRRLKNKEKKNKVMHLLLLKKFFFQLNIKPA